MHHHVASGKLSDQIGSEQVENLNEIQIHQSIVLSPDRCISVTGKRWLCLAYGYVSACGAIGRLIFLELVLT
jgi:hypothetical protein